MQTCDILRPRNFRLQWAGLFSVFAAMTLTSVAQTVTTVPVGAVTVTIAAGTGTVKNATIVSFPLINSTVVNGTGTGVIASITSNTITCTSAGWTSSALAQSATPYLVKITTGSAAGRTFIISGNTADTLTINTSDGVSATPVDLSSLGIATGSGGDTFKIENADTILSIFGAGDSLGAAGPLGGSNPNLVDTIQLNIANSYQTYYYDTTQSSWVNVASEALSNNVIIRPDAAVIYNRIQNTAFTILVTGLVPDIPRRSIVRSGQVTILSTYWPLNTTLAGLALQNLSGWVAASDPNIADTVQLRMGSSWKTCYYDGSNWIDLASEAVANGFTVGAGSGLTIRKRAVTGTPVIFNQALPYSL